MTDLTNQSRQLPKPLFRIPREIRDHIYTLALSHETHFLHHRGLLITAWTAECPANRHPKCSESHTANFGLPEWLLTSKAVCTEALSIFHRTRTFSPGLRALQRDAASTITNSLVFQPNAIRKIEISAPYVEKHYNGAVRHQTHYTVAAPRLFLAHMRPFLSEHPQIRVEWRLCYASCWGLQEPWSFKALLPLYTTWAKAWGGRFWKIEVIFWWCGDRGCQMLGLEKNEELRRWKAGAEEYALELVGSSKEGVTAVWGPCGVYVVPEPWAKTRSVAGGSNDDNDLTQYHSLVMCRKI